MCVSTLYIGFMSCFIWYIVSGTKIDVFGVELAILHMFSMPLYDELNRSPWSMILWRCCFTRSECEIYCRTISVYQWDKKDCDNWKYLWMFDVKLYRFYQQWHDYRSQKNCYQNSDLIYLNRLRMTMTHSALNRYWLWHFRCCLLFLKRANLTEEFIKFL